MSQCTCCIVPKDVLERFAEDKKLKMKLRKAAKDSAKITDVLRGLRFNQGELTKLSLSTGIHFAQLASAPAVTVYDCKNTSSTPGTPISNPSTVKDSTVKCCFKETLSVAQFYKDVFGRNSIDNAGMTMMSSVHYSEDYNNAMWSGNQMIYGDGDGQLFTNFTSSNDVIAHELTHGITQHSLQLAYHGDAGGLNESMSDCFGSMFRQWSADKDSSKADWLIGADILGATAKARGFTCLRNMANPADRKALAPQPIHYSQITPGMDPHYSSGPPNLAFATACLTAGGKSWEQIGQVWYAALTTSGANPNMTMPQFAARTRQLAVQLYPKLPNIGVAMHAGWNKVGL